MAIKINDPSCTKPQCLYYFLLGGSATPSVSGSVGAALFPTAFDLGPQFGSGFMGYLKCA